MNATMRTAALGTATALALAAAPPAATADYQFIINGDPEYDPPASHLASDGTSLAAGPFSKLGPADALEARFRTSMASTGLALRSDVCSGFIIIVR